MIETLSATIKCGDDPSEGYRFLAECYLKLDPPEPKKARDALKEYMVHVSPSRGESQQRQLSQARLQLGEIHTQLGEPDEVRKMLERIGPDSPPDLLIAARMQLAKGYLAEQDWTQAMRCLEQARDVRGVTANQKMTILYLLAEAYQKANKCPETISALEQLRRGAGPEAQAAAFRLAEWQLSDPVKPEAAVDALEFAALTVKAGDNYENKLLPIGDVRTIFETAIQKFRTAGAFELTVRAARAYERFAEMGRDRELAAEALQAWGQALLDRAVQVEASERPKLVEDGTKHIRDAAREWQQAAMLKKMPADKGDPLYKAAELYLKAGDQQEALKMLDELLLRVPDFPETRQAEVWLKKGEFYLADGNREQAKLCFQNGVQLGERHPSPALLKCRIRLAEVLLKSSDSKTIARAIADLENSLSDPDFTNDRDLHASAMLFIAEAYFQQKNYRKAEIPFRTLLNNYPENARAIYARFMIGQCYWFIAGQEADKCKAAKKLLDDANVPEDRKREADAQYETSYKQYMDWLKKAAEPFKVVETALLNGMENPSLAPADAELLRKASLAAADCAFFAGGYEDCVARYDAIAQRYAGTVVQLEALRSMWRCYQYYLQNADKSVDTLTQMRTAYLQMPDAEFDGSSEVRRREYWQRWFEQVAPMKK